MADNAWLTTAGESKIVNALASTTPFNITKWRLGETANVPFNAGLTDVVGTQVDNGTVAEMEFDVISQDNIIMRVILDESKGPYSIGNVGLFSDDDTMIAIGTFEIQRPKTPNAVGVVGNRLVLNVPLNFVDVQSAINFTVYTNIFSSWPFVQTIADLPDPNLAPFEGYIVREDPSQNRPITAIRNEEPASSGNFVWTFDYHNKIAGDAASNINCIEIDTTTGDQTFSINSIERMKVTQAGLTVSTNRSLYLDDGSASSPVLRFTNDDNTGIFRVTTDQMGFTTGGTERIRIDSAGHLNLLTGQIRAINGTLAIPSYSFTIDPNSGFYWGSSGLVNYSSNGVSTVGFGNDGLYIYNSRRLLNQDGTAALPSYTFNGDQDTGIFQPFDDTVSITTAGTEHSRFDSGGLTLFGGAFRALDGSAGGPSYTFNDDTNTGLFSPSNDSIAITTSGVEKLRITSSGNTGIGETNPLGKLHVKNNNSGVTGASIAADEFIIENDTVAGMTIASTSLGTIYFARPFAIAAGGITYDHSSDELRFRVDNTDRLQITNSAVQLLAGTAFQFQDGTAALPGIGFVSDPGVGLSRVASNILVFSTSAVEQMRINASGFMGIGTQNPHGPLHVAEADTSATSGSTADTLTLETNGFTGITMIGGNSAGSRIDFKNASNNNTAGSFSVSNSTGDMVLGADNDVQISAGGFTRVRVESGGRVQAFNDVLVGNAFGDQALIGGSGNIELTHGFNPYIDFKNVYTDDYDARIIMDHTTNDFIYDVLGPGNNDHVFRISSVDVVRMSTQFMISDFPNFHDMRINGSNKIAINLTDNIYNNITAHTFQVSGTSRQRISGTDTWLDNTSNQDFRINGFSKVKVENDTTSVNSNLTVRRFDNGSVSSVTAFRMFSNSGSTNGLDGFSIITSGSATIMQNHELAGNLTIATDNTISLSATNCNLPASCVRAGNLSTLLNQGSINILNQNIQYTGGEYSFSTEISTNGGATWTHLGRGGAEDGDGFNTMIGFAAYELASISLNFRARYVTSSPPYKIGGIDYPFFAYILIEKDTGLVVGTSFAADPSWAYNGPTDIRADRYDSASGKAYKKRCYFDKEKREVVREEVEITYEFKNSDMNIVPHPFGELSDKYKVVMVAPTDQMMKDLSDLNEAGEHLPGLFHKEYIKLGDEFEMSETPSGVIICEAKWKNS